MPYFLRGHGALYSAVTVSSLQAAETSEREFGLDRQEFFRALRRQRAVVDGFAFFLMAEPAFTLMNLTDASWAPGTVSTSGTSASSFLLYSPRRADVVPLREDFQQHRFVAEREEHQAAARGVERLDRRCLRDDFFAEGDEALDLADRAGRRALRAAFGPLPDGSSVETAQVGKPLGCSLVPAGR